MIRYAEREQCGHRQASQGHQARQARRALLTPLRERQVIEEIVGLHCVVRRARAPAGGAIEEALAPDLFVNEADVFVAQEEALAPDLFVKKKAFGGSTNQLLSSAAFFLITRRDRVKSWIRNDRRDRLRPISK